LRDVGVIHLCRPGKREIDGQQRPLILILVAVNETIEDVMTTGEGEWWKMRFSSSDGFEWRSWKRSPPAARPA
jgi:hypothetical protein